MQNNKPEQPHHVNPFERLDHIVRLLRSPDGCPWDRKQTPESLKKYLLEEAAELAEAVDLGDARHICEEIGDMYFILALFTVIFEEQKRFSAHDALETVCRKMVRRHPHVFEPGNEGQPVTEQELRAQWERIKNEEKRRDQRHESY